MIVKNVLRTSPYRKSCDGLGEGGLGFSPNGIVVLCFSSETRLSEVKTKTKVITTANQRKGNITTKNIFCVCFQKNKYT